MWSEGEGWEDDGCGGVGVERVGLCERWGWRLERGGCFVEVFGCCVCALVEVCLDIFCGRMCE